MPIKVVNTWPPKHMIHGLIEHEEDRCMTQLPSGKHTKSYWKWAIYSGFTHWKWWFSIVMLVYQRVIWINRWPLQSLTKYSNALGDTTWLSDFDDCVTHSALQQVSGICRVSWTLLSTPYFLFAGDTPWIFEYHVKPTKHCTAFTTTITSTLW
jgi:hypothetical protein